MKENSGPIHFFNFVTLLFLTISVIVSFTSTTIYTNTPADEVKIEELVKDEFFKGGNSMSSVGSIRSDVIKKYYSKEIREGFDQTPVKILLTIAATSFIIAMYYMICGFLEDIDIGAYYKKKAEYWDQRAKKENQILQELIELQRKISTKE